MQLNLGVFSVWMLTLDLACTLWVGGVDVASFVGGFTSVCEFWGARVGII